MKKCLFIIAIALLAVGNMQAEGISADQALQIAKQFSTNHSTKQLARGNT